MNLTSKSIHKTTNISVMKEMLEMGHEQIVYCSDKKTGLKAIIAIHDTTLGPALGGTRMWDYRHEKEAIEDVLRLSRGMSLKASISGLNLGGGKAVIIGNSKKDKTPELMKSFGRFVDSLGGKYITAEDVGMTTKDMEYVRSATKYVTGIPEKMGGSGNPSPFTAFGVYMGMKASARYKWGTDILEGKKIVVQGIGHVGESLVGHLKKEGASVFVNDIDSNRVKYICNKYSVTSIDQDSIYDFDMDIYSPCALGSVLNPHTISRLKCSIIAGAANNQLSDETRDGKLLLEKKILYAPDFLINAGGLINVYSELNGYDKQKSTNKTKEIYNTTLDIFEKAELSGTTTHEAALEIAKNRISDSKKL